MVPRSTIHKRKREFFRSCFCIIMSSSAPSDISQNDTEALEKQRQEMQRRHEEEQRSLLQLQEAIEACRAERVAQKARREAEAKAKEEAERQRVAEEEGRKKRTMEYEDEEEGSEDGPRESQEGRTSSSASC